MKKLHCKIKALAADRGLSLTYLGYETGVSKQTMSSLSTNKIKFINSELIAKLCNLLECDLDDLFELR